MIDLATEFGETECGIDFARTLQRAGGRYSIAPQTAVIFFIRTGRIKLETSMKLRHVVLSVALAVGAATASVASATVLAVSGLAGPWDPVDFG